MSKSAFLIRRDFFDFLRKEPLSFKKLPFFIIRELRRLDLKI